MSEISCKADKITPDWPFFPFGRFRLTPFSGYSVHREKNAPDYRQESQNLVKNSTRLFLFNGAPQGAFFGTCYTLGWQGIQPPVAAMTIVIGNGRGKSGE
jgi:hypothetical protein